MVQKDLPTVQYDRTRMMQVFQNLIGNAVKYMDKPNGIVKVICADEGSYWQFTIRDNGAGIHWRYFDKIFQLFQTLAPRDKVESTGVGLALVKKIVTMWGGKISGWSRKSGREVRSFLLCGRRERRTNCSEWKVTG